MKLTVELTDAQVAQLDELSAMKRVSREELLAGAVEEYLYEVRGLRINVHQDVLQELTEAMAVRRQHNELAAK